MRNFFKCMVAGISALVMCLSAVPLSASAATTYKKGDVNGDGTVNSADTLALNMFLHGLASAKDGSMAERLDVNQNGVIDQNDLKIVKDINLGTASTTTIPSKNTTNLPTRESRKYCIFNTNLHIGFIKMMSLKLQQILLPFLHII